MPQAAASRVAGSLLPLLLAMGLLYLGAPQTIAAFVSLPNDYLLERIQIGESVNARDFDILIISRERALVWVEAGRVQKDLALAQLVLAKASGHRFAPRRPGQGAGAALRLDAAGLRRA